MYKMAPRCKHWLTLLLQKFANPLHIPLAMGRSPHHPSWAGTYVFRSSLLSL